MLHLGFAPVEASAAAVIADLNVTFANTYNQAATAQLGNLSRVMELGVQSTKVAERYFYWETLPYPERWPRGEEIPREAFEGVSYDVENLDWGKAIDFHENDVQDERTGTLDGRVRQLARQFVSLPTRIFFQVIAAAVDPKLLETIPNAPDGAALYSATDGGGNARFTRTGGNIVTGSGVDSAQAIRDDAYQGAQAIGSFLDTKGQPLFDGDVLDGVYLIVFGMHLLRVFREAFGQAQVIQIVQNVAATENVAAAGVTNLLQQGGMQFVLWPTIRITSDDWLLFNLNVPVKPIFQQVRMAVRTDEDNRSNSPITRRTKMHSFQADGRFGYGVNLPHGTVLINN